MASGDDLTLSGLIRTISLRRRQVLIVGIVGAFLGVTASLALPADYEATSSVFVAPIGTSTIDGGTPLPPNMDTEIGLAESKKVSQRASDDLGGSPEPADISRSTTVSNPDNSSIIEFAVQAGSSDRAETIAAAVAQAYLDLRRENASREIDQSLESIASGLDRLGANEAAADAAARALGSRRGALLSASTSPGSVITPADSTASRTLPGPFTLGLAGLALGLLIGVGSALVSQPIETLDRRIGAPEDLEGVDSRMVVDGTQDSDPAVTWDVATHMLSVPPTTGSSFLILIDAGPRLGGRRAGQELVRALTRKDYPALYVDASALPPGRIAEGWPTESKRRDWGSRIIVIDASSIGSPATKAELARRVDLVVLSRSVDDDFNETRRLARMIRRHNVDIDLLAIFPTSVEAVGPLH